MQVPGFQIKRTIGRGGMATAYLAMQESLEREVVLKVMNAAQSDSKDFLERFINEGRIVAALRHPHIITIFDIGSANDLVYIAMEYVEGGDLKTRIEEPIEPEEALDLLERVASALGYAHAKGIVHRDVKPANILFRDDGTVLLSDFGIAKQVQSDSELTSTGTILGSPFYMSPEQAEGLQVDGRTDLYSLGVIFFEMLTGRRPYQGDSAIKVIMQHIQSPTPKLPPELQDYQPLLERLMEKNRDKRVPDAAALIREIQVLRRRLAAASQPAGAPGAGTAPVRGGLFSDLRALGLLGAIAIAAGGYGIYLYGQFSRPPALIKRAPMHSPSGNLESLGQSLAPPAQAAPAIAVAAAGPESNLDRADVVRALEWLARHSLNEDRLTHPPADNAYYYYSRLLAMDPANDSAHKGFSEIAERFVVLAEEAFSRREYGKAQAYIALGLQVEPDNRGLISLQSFIQNREKSILESVLDLFHGSG